MPMFRKKPVVIEAVQWTGENKPAIDAFVCGIAADAADQRELGMTPDLDLVIPTLEGNHLARPGDWIIRGVKGEFYPCKPDIFEATYDEATKAVAREPDAVIHRDGEVLHVFKV